MKTSVFVRNKTFGPSCTYRICKYIDNIDNIGTDINIYQYSSDNDYRRTRNLDKHKLLARFNQGYLFIKGTFSRIIDMLRDIYFNKPDTVFIQREIFPKYLPRLVSKLLVKYLDNVETIIWDFDDNIMENNEISEREYNLLCEKSDYIIVSTEFLKNIIPDRFKHKCKILHTTDYDMCDIKLDDINKNRLLNFDKEVYLIWVGTFSNIKYLNNIIPYLDKAAEELNKNNQKLILRVVANGGVTIKTRYLHIENIEWTREIALENIMKSHIGLMPLESTQYTLGKAGFKAVQYIGMGLPTIVSDVGFNSEVVEDNINGFLVREEEEWTSKVIELCIDKKLWNLQSKEARIVWNKKFNSKDTYNYLVDLLSVKE